MLRRTESLLKAIGRRVADARRARGFTQEKLAEVLKVSPRYLQRIEAGEENLTVDTLVKLAAKLKVGVDEFFSTAARSTPRPRGTKTSK